MPRQHELRVFEGSFLEVPRVGLLYTATVIRTTMIPQFSFWNQSYWFAPNSKFQLATKDQEMHEQDELKTRLFNKDRTSLVAKV